MKFLHKLLIGERDAVWLLGNRGRVRFSQLINNNALQKSIHPLAIYRGLSPIAERKNGAMKSLLLLALFQLTLIGRTEMLSQPEPEYLDSNPQKFL